MESASTPFLKKTTFDKSLTYIKIQSKEFVDLTWENIPHHILVKIFESLSWKDRLSASSICWTWRGVLLTPVLWRNVKLVLGNNHSNRKALFLSPCLRNAHFVDLSWTNEMRGSKRCFTKVSSMSVETRKVALEVIETLDSNVILESLKIHFDNIASFDGEFAKNICQRMEIIVKNNKQLRYLSFGANPFFIPNNIMEIVPTTCPLLEDLHVATLPPQIGSYIEATFQMLTVSFLTSHFKHLRRLSLDWKHLSGHLLRGLTTRVDAVSLSSLQTFLSCKEDCTINHPSSTEWTEFGVKNKDLKVYLVFIYSFEGLCQAVENITLPVFIKILECQQINVGNFEQVVTWHREHICGLAIVNTLTSPVYDPANSLMLAGLIQWCHKLRYLSIIGRFIPAEGVLWMTQNFNLEQHIVSKKHILTAAESCSYLIPISAGKYAQFRRDMSTAIGKDWDALSRIPLKGCYFCDGQDNYLYLSGNYTT